MVMLTSTLSWCTTGTVEFESNRRNGVFLGCFRNIYNKTTALVMYYRYHGTPCVAAHSVVRALYAAYDGPLYQVVRTTDKQTMNVSTLAAGGFANGDAQSAFCNEGEGEGEEGSGTADSNGRWAPGPCCSDSNPGTCPNHCDKKAPGACPKDPGCVGCAVS